MFLFHVTSFEESNGEYGVLFVKIVSFERSYDFILQATINNPVPIEGALCFENASQARYRGGPRR